MNLVRIAFRIFAVVFIAGQHAAHAERDTVLANPSVCPSVRHTLVLYLNEYTHRQTLSTPGRARLYSVLSATAGTNFLVELPQRGR